LTQSDTDKTDRSLVYAPDLRMQLDTIPRGFWGNWIAGGQRLDEHRSEHESHPWYRVLWLTGVDYFSTLGYQPGIALLAAGSLAPLATAILVLVTLCGALPIYHQVARRSFAGQGSIAMLENILSGWKGKLFVLVLLGFAATDFVITMTLSAADAAQHAIENPYLHPYLGDARMILTLLMLALLAAVFLRGFVEAIGLATMVAIPYILLNVIVLARGMWEVACHPALINNWTASLRHHGDWTSLLLVSMIIFPKLALGMSGFETGVSVMPLIKGDPEDRTRPDAPHGRIRATRKLLASAAVIMSILLLLSSFTTALLIPESAYKLHGPAAGRAIAYLAHGLLGSTFGTIYDISTILILWFAGASAMAGLLNLIPRYLPRFGMAPRWVAFSRPLVLILFFANIIVTLVFKADVEAQGGAYATGVLVLMFSAAFAVTLVFRHEAREHPNARGKFHLFSVIFGGVTLVFAYTLVDNVLERPDGVIVAAFFILIIVLLSAMSRVLRATEFRVRDLHFTDENSLALWHTIIDRKVHLVPLKTFTLRAMKEKAEEIRQYYQVKEPVAFIHVYLLNNRSDFFAPLRLRLRELDDGSYIIEVYGAIAIANSIAYISELIDPISIFLGLTRQSLMMQSLRFLFWGEGETGLMVYKILRSYWDRTPEEDIRPHIFLMSD
jgi:hypothetical protein